MALERKNRSGLSAGGSKSGKNEIDSARKSVPGDVGSALRSAYDQAISEDIPSEMLDLLGKLA